jgi:formylglycine-generating enzyme required for sulfatase activity
VTLGSPGGEIARQSDETLRSVRITRPFYMGVYEVTQRQWEDIAGVSRSRPSFWNNAADWEERPVEQVSYYDIRENASSNGDNPGINWPTTVHAVDAGSFMGKLRAKTGNVLAFDLPTEAQWEYACRAGTSGAWNNGTTITNGTSDANLNLLGRYQRDGGHILVGSTWTEPHTALGDRSAVTAEYATAKVGSYLPNAWGLYDMHGNVWEWTLDWYIASDVSLSGDDPQGPDTGSARVRRSGCWSFGTETCRSARRANYLPSTQNYITGFRVAAVAAVWMPPVGE